MRHEDILKGKIKNRVAEKYNGVRVNSYEMNYGIESIRGTYLFDMYMGADKKFMGTKRFKFIYHSNTGRILFGHTNYKGYLKLSKTLK